MPNIQEFFDILTKIAWFTTILTNLLLIYLTVFRVKRIYGAYKYMIIIFASLGIIFSFIEQFSRPFVHNYNKGLMFFSTGWSSLKIPDSALLAGIVVYAGFYVLVVAFAAVQFVYRYLVLMNPDNSKKFEGAGVILWILYPLVIGLSNGAAFFVFAYPDTYSNEYMRNEILEVYNLNIIKVPRLLLVPYDAKGHIRWLNTSYLFIGAFFLLSQYIIIIYCAFKMRLQMHIKLQKLSVPNRKLQKQFFHALVVQIFVPTIIFVFPSTPLLLGPLLNLRISIRSGGICALLSLYPPIDSLVFMLIVTEYRNLLIRKCTSKSHPHPPHCTI